MQKIPTMHTIQYNTIQYNTIRYNTMPSKPIDSDGIRWKKWIQRENHESIPTIASGKSRMLQDRQEVHSGGTGGQPFGTRRHLE